MLYAITNQFRTRIAFPIILAAGLVVVLVNEITYAQITRTVQSGIALTEIRIAAARCLQLLTDAETAQRGYLLTGREAYLAPYEAARRELPEVLEPTLRFLATGGPGNVAAAQKVRALIGDRLAELGLTISLMQSGRRDAAMDVLGSDLGVMGMAALRQAFTVALARAAEQQTQARVSIFDGLLINRIVVAALAVVGVFALWLFLRQRLAAEAARVRLQEQLESDIEARTLDLRQLAGHLQTVREDERGRLARELHDEMGGLLSALKLDVLRLRNGRDIPAAAVEKITSMGQRLDQVIALKRRVIEDLHPSSLDMLGLKASIEALCRDAADGLGIKVVEELEDVTLPSDAQLTVYRLVQESLTNIRKYANANQARVRLRRDGHDAVVEIHDDGRGFDVNAVHVGRHGLAGMRYRVESHGGRMTIASVPGQGTTMSACLPLQRA